MTRDVNKGPLTEQTNRGRGNAHVVQVSPTFAHDLPVLRQLEYLKIIDEMAIRKSTLGLKAQSFENLHLGNDESILEVVKLCGKVVHRHVGGEGRGGWIGRGGAMRDEREEVGVGVDQVADSKRGFFKFGSEEEGAETNVLVGGGGGQGRER
jgi:hypothetical protein